MAQFDHGYALLIGVNENKVPGWSIPTAANDVAAVAQALADPERCAYAPEHIKLINGVDATRQGILDGLDWLYDQLKADGSGSASAGASATAIILYAGHGWEEAAAVAPEGAAAPKAAYYLIPYDVRQENLRSRALRVEDFAAGIDTLPPCQLLILLDGSPQSDFPESALPPGLLMAEGRAVLSSSRAGQAAYDRPDGKTSLFIDAVVEALSGKTPAQTAGNKVLLMDLINHVMRAVPQSAQASWGKVQQPDFQASGNFPVALRLGGREVPTQPEAAPPAPRVTSYTANTGGGDFTGRDKIIHGDEIHGDKVTGDKFSGDKVGRDKIAGDSIKVGDISGDGSAIAIGRNARANVTGISGADLERAFAPMVQALRDVPPEKQAEATQKVDELKKEVAKGSKANDSRMAALLDELVGMVPGMVTVVASTFGTPLLGGIAGPVTSFVVDRIRGVK